MSAWCEQASSQPPQDDPVWQGRTGGSILACTRPSGSLVPDPGQRYLTWAADAASAPAPPDPEEIARRVLARLQLQPPALGIFPRGDITQRMSYVGWHMWLWADPASPLDPRSASETEAGITVTLDASVASIEWDMGNGDTVTCGTGTAWSLARTNGGHNIASPDCGYRYESAARYTVAATANWHVAWTGGGQSGVIELPLSTSAEVIVGEMQSLNVNPGR